MVSFNGIWGLERPMVEARRVLRGGGRFGISFFGAFDRMDLMNSWVIALLEFASGVVRLVNEWGWVTASG